MGARYRRRREARVLFAVEEVEALHRLFEEPVEEADGVERPLERHVGVVRLHELDHLEDPRDVRGLDCFVVAVVFRLLDVVDVGAVVDRRGEVEVGEDVAQELDVLEVVRRLLEAGACLPGATNSCRRTSPSRPATATCSG